MSSKKANLRYTLRKTAKKYRWSILSLANYRKYAYSNIILTISFLIVTDKTYILRTALSLRSRIKNELSETDKTNCIVRPIDSFKVGDILKIIPIADYNLRNNCTCSVCVG